MNDYGCVLFELDFKIYNHEFYSVLIHRYILWLIYSICLGNIDI